MLTSLYFIVIFYCLAIISHVKSDIDNKNSDQDEQKDQNGGKSARTKLLNELFGSTLYRWDNTGNNPSSSSREIEELSTSKLLNNKKVIGVYFSASWCGPCRQFTPVLSQFYDTVRKNNKNNFELIFVSRDRSPDEFLQYYSKMPWLSITWDNVNTIGSKLATLYQVKGIPHLVILDGDDLTVITTDGRTHVLKDKYGLEFPWRPRTLLSLVPKPVRKYLVKKSQKMFLDLKKVLSNVMTGLLNGLAPSKVVEVIKEKSRILFGFVLRKSITMIKKGMEYVMNQIQPSSTISSKHDENIADTNSYRGKRRNSDSGTDLILVENEGDEDYGLAE